MMKASLVLVLFWFYQSLVCASSVRVVSNHSLEDTVERYTAALRTAQIPMLKERSFEQRLPGGFSRKGKEIQFSNPFYGWNLGECHRGERKDRPMTTRVWKDNNGQVWLEYMAPDNPINSFGVIECGNETDKVQRALTGFASAATQ